jgi:hypothetical protein
MRTWIFLVMMLLACVGLAMGADATTAEQSAGGGSNWLIQLLQGLESLLWIAILTAGVWVVKLGIDKNKSDEQIAKIYDALTQAVDEIYENTVREIKLRAADGKLTSQERRELPIAAWNLAQSKLDFQTRQILASWTVSKAVSAVKAIIEKKKAATPKTIVVEVNHVASDSTIPAASADAANSDMAAEQVAVSGK